LDKEVRRGAFISSAELTGIPRHRLGTSKL
jgi:hypothetical protein